jgi:hypothetical protein
MDRAPGDSTRSESKQVARFEREIRTQATRDAAIRRLREDPLLQCALAEAYGLPIEHGLPGLDFSNCELLAAPSGRASFVLEARSRPEHLWGPTQALVVKFLHFSRLDDPTTVGALAAEADATRRAQPDRYLFSARGVLVTVRMPGIPLTDWLERQPWWNEQQEGQSSAYIGERVEAMRSIGVSLCRSLREMSEDLGAGHGNLDLSSVLITEDAGTLSVNLIDLAPDGTLGQGKSDSGYDRCIRSDARGVGVAMLQVATPYRIDAKSGLDGEAVQRSLAALWGDAPGFARIVEDLVDKDPARRLAMLTDGKPSQRPWVDLEARIQDEYELQRLFRPPIDTPSGGDASVTTWGQVRRYFQATRHVHPGTGSGWPSSGLLRWLNVFAYGFWVLALTGFVLLTSADLGLNAPGGATAAFIEQHAHFTVGNFDANFPGRLIAISFAYVALTFYMRILAGVTVSRLGVPWIELGFRSAPLVLNIPVVVVIYYDPGLWAAAATVGLLAAVALCLAMRELDRRALDAMQSKFHYSAVALREAREARTPHESWWRTVGAYLVVVLLPLDLGLYSTDLGLADHNILRDGAFYAVLLTFGLNFYAIYWNSIRKLERNTRGCLEQSSFILRRAARLDPSSLAPSAFSGSQVRGGTLAFIPAIPVFAGTVYVASGWNRSSVQWTLLAIALVGLAVMAVLAAIHRVRQRGREASIPVRACFAVAVAFAAFALLSFLALRVDGVLRMAAIFAIACMATALGDQMFKHALGGSRRWRQSRNRVKAPQSTTGFSVEALVQAERALAEGQAPEAVSLDLGYALIGSTSASSRDEVESRLIGAWEATPNVARVAERLLISAKSDERIVIGSIPELRRLRTEITKHEAPRRGMKRLFLSPQRAAICLATPGERLRPEASRALTFVGLASVAIGALCTAGWIAYAFKDPDWTRTAGRTLALSYSLSAVYYYRMIIGWITVTGMHRKATELALRSVPFVFQGPAITAIFLWPTLWPLEATIGVGATALINFLMLRLIRDAAHALREFGGWSVADTEKLTRTHFASWWTTATIYLSGVLLFDILLTAIHVLHDAALYALVLAAGANLYAIVYSSLRKNGPAVRGQVARAVVLLRVLAPVPERVGLQIEGPRRLLVSQAFLAGLAALWLSLVDPNTDSVALAALISLGASLSVLIMAAALQGVEEAPDSPRAQALSRLMASLACWAAGAAFLAAGSALHLQLAALLAFAGAIPVALWLADPTPPPPPEGRVVDAAAPPTGRLRYRRWGKQSAPFGEPDDRARPGPQPARGKTGRRDGRACDRGGRACRSGVSGNVPLSRASGTDRCRGHHLRNLLGRPERIVHRSRTGSTGIDQLSRHRQPSLRQSDATRHWPTSHRLRPPVRRVDPQSQALQ